MVDIIIHIENDVEIWDENVFVECKLPQVPAIGSILHLTPELETELERKAEFSETKENYYPQWIYRSNGNLVSFSDAIEVKYVKYEPNNYKVRITLGAS